MQRAMFWSRDRQSLSELENLTDPTLNYIEISFLFPINYCWLQLIIAVLTKMKVSRCGHPSPSFLGLLVCVQTPLLLKQIGERENFFFEGRGQLYTGKGLLDMDFPSSVMENNAVL